MRISSFRHALSLLLATTLLPGSTLLASETVAYGSPDFALGQDGTLVGSVLNQSAKPVAGLHVHVLHENRVVATAISDGQGRFSVSGLRNGSHALQIGAIRNEVRFWSTDAAPPATVSRMAIVVDEELVRGQDCGEGCGDGCGDGCGEGACPSGMGCWGKVGGLLLIGGAVAATLALTLDDDDDTPASP